jgi:citrate lyase subunit beta / citryl-CoA lyase
MSNQIPAMPVAPLFVPGDRPERFSKVAPSGADAIILDLEDAVSEDRKEMARKAVASWISCDMFTIVRVNAAKSAWFDEDINALRNNRPHAIMLPKAEDPDEIAILRDRLNLPIIPLIETVKGVGRLGDILQQKGVLFAAFGVFDFALDLGAAPEWEPLLLARLQLVLHSRLANLPPPLDGPSSDIENEKAIEDDGRRASSLGFAGKLAIHPKQIVPIKRAFYPDDEVIAWAKEIVKLDTGEARRFGTTMVDRPVIERARRVLLRAGLPLSKDRYYP